MLKLEHDDVEDMMQQGWLEIALIRAHVGDFNKENIQTG